MSMSAAPTLHQLLPWQPRFMPWSGGRVHYLDEGPRDAPVLLCLHGFPTWSLLFRQPLGALMNEWRVLAVDLPGFGCSDAQPSAVTPAGVTALLSALLESAGVDRVHLLAHGAGVRLALDFVARHQNAVERCCLVSGSATNAPMLGTSWYEWLLDRQADARLDALFEDLDTLLPGLMRRMGTGHGFSLGATQMEGYAAVFRNGSARAAALRLLEQTDLAPLPQASEALPAVISEHDALLVYGGLDRTLDIEAATRELGTAFPQHRCVHLPGVGHFVPEEAGDLLSSLLAVFLRDRESS
ncbi:MAG: alpha/beta fold hydrolase [Gammaproteobacteria bacterium]|nr:alpha/beta fold hydrolase [Gammaproteobacteria bacterium]